MRREKTNVIVTDPIHINVIRIEEIFIHFSLFQRFLTLFHYRQGGQGDHFGLKRGTSSTKQQK